MEKTRNKNPKKLQLEQKLKFGSALKQNVIKFYY